VYLDKIVILELAVFVWYRYVTCIAVCFFVQPKAEKVCGFRNLDRLGPAEVARLTVDLLPTLCQHTESASAFFQVFTSNSILHCPCRRK